VKQSKEVLTQASAAAISHTDLRCALTGPNTQPGGVQDGFSRRLYQPFTSSFTRKPVAKEMPSSGTTATACASGSAVIHCLLLRRDSRQGSTPADSAPQTAQRPSWSA